MNNIIVADGHHYMKGVMLKEKPNYRTKFREINMRLKDVFGLDRKPATGMAAGDGMAPLIGTLPHMAWLQGMATASMQQLETN